VASVSPDRARATSDPVAKNGTIGSRRLTGDTVYRVAKKREAEAGIKPFGPHDLRRSYLSEMLDRGVDLLTVRAWAGHASSDTIALYDRRGERALEGAASTLAVFRTASRLYSSEKFLLLTMTLLWPQYWPFWMCPGNQGRTRRAVTPTNENAPAGAGAPRLIEVENARRLSSPVP
jgi:hypothetical protein